MKGEVTLFRGPSRSYDPNTWPWTWLLHQTKSFLLLRTSFEGGQGPPVLSLARGPRGAQRQLGVLAAAWGRSGLCTDLRGIPLIPSKCRLRVPRQQDPENGMRASLLGVPQTAAPHALHKDEGQGLSSGAWDSWSFTNHPGGEAAGRASSPGLGRPLRARCRVRGLGRSEAGAPRHAHASLWAQPSAQPHGGGPPASTQPCAHRAPLARSS